MSDNQKRKILPKFRNQNILPSTDWVLSFQGIKRPEHEANYSLPSSVDLKNDWSSSLRPLHYFMACTHTSQLSLKVRVVCCCT